MSPDTVLPESDQIRRKVDQMARLLPGVFQRTHTEAELAPLDALLSVMARLQLGPETTLEELDAFFDPERARPDFLIFLAYWVDLEGLLAPGLPPGLAWLSQADLERRVAKAFPTGLRRLRALVAAAVPLLRMRGATQGLRRFLETATGIPGFVVTESLDRPFHIDVAYPAEAEPHLDFMRRAIEYQKPAYLTYELIEMAPHLAKTTPGGEKLTHIEGIGETYAGKLRAAGIQTTRDLLEQGATRAARRAIARKTGISQKLILKWVNNADLFRIQGVSEEYADLLEAAGVDTVPDLARRNPEHLYPRLVAVNQKKALVRRLPSLAAVRDWVEQARQLPRVITY